MLPAPRFLFVLIVVFGSVAAIFLLRKKFPAKKVIRWTPWLLATVAAFFIVFLLGAYLSSKGPNWQCRRIHQTDTEPPSSLATANDYFEQGNYEFDRGNCSEAIIDYSLSIAQDPQFAESYNNRAYTYMMLNDYPHALQDLDQALAIRPDYVNALMNRGDIYNFYYNINRAKAMEDYNRAYAADPTHGSICGHRMLARNNGWTLGAYLELLIKGTKAGCP